MYNFDRCPNIPDNDMNVTYVYECPVERCAQRNIYHNVKHIVPINTHIINNHIYRHSYDSCYSCSECNTRCDVYENCPPRL